jgi:hypothetical protein
MKAPKLPLLPEVLLGAQPTDQPNIHMAVCEPGSEPGSTGRPEKLFDLYTKMTQAAVKTKNATKTASRKPA